MFQGFRPVKHGNTGHPNQACQFHQGIFYVFFGIDITADPHIRLMYRVSDPVLHRVQFQPQRNVKT